MITISEILDPAGVQALRRQADMLVWKDGDETAGAAAQRVKKNSQADLSSRTGAAMRQTIEQALFEHPVLKAAAWPRQFSKPLISRMEIGDGYGLHVDNPLIGSGAQRMRTDLSYTLFLSAPDDYEGGELVIELMGETHRVKGKAGDVVVYPSTSLHRVRPVTAGTRLVCVGWIESMVRDAAQREILFDLENVRAELAKTRAPEAPEMLVISKTIANLLRQWAQP